MEKQQFYLHNEKTKISYDISEKIITGKDLTDPLNEPKFFTDSRRGLAKAWKVLHDKFSEDTTMYQASSILRAENIRVHSYCGVN